jgi:gamma-glutamylcyclotransferase (GGCT)/AIG2-like uncharacterized protein YtfP
VTDRLSLQPYFAYGSNLNRADMRRRCPDAHPGVPARLHGWRLTFRGVADIEPAAGRTVHGALWWLSRADVRNLDAYEGAPTYYRRRTVEVLTDDGPVEAMTYVMTGDSYRGLPSPWYLGRIEEGFRDWGLPLDELRRAVTETRDRLTGLGIERYRPDGRKRLRALTPAEARLRLRRP